MKQELILGDCLEKMKDIPSYSVDLIFSDLPYGTTSCSWDSIIPLDKLWEEYRRISKLDAAILLFGAYPFTFKLIESNFKCFKYCWYWNKDKAANFLKAKHQPLRVVEEIVVFGNKKVKYRPQMVKASEENKRPRHNKRKNPDDGIYANKIVHFTESENHNENLRYPKNLINIKSTAAECNSAYRMHPTQKPISLCEYLIKSYSDEGDIVLDSCMGVGSIPLAAKNLNRGYIGIEKDEKYFEICVERVGGTVIR